MQLPQRIVSLVPSQTELLYTLGLDTKVVGITKFCVHPSFWFREKICVGGTKDIHIDIVHQLKPDLILANKEENVREQVETLARHYPVWVSDISTLPDALDMITTVGALTGKTIEAAALNDEITRSFETLIPHAPLRTAYFIWRNPYMTVGGDTFIHDMLQRCGLVNIFAGEKRYPQVDLQTLKARDCQLVLLSSEPYPFKEKHIAEIQACLPAAQVRLVDGEMFSWYGSRLTHSAEYIAKLTTG